MEQRLINRQTSISGNVVLLCRFLRSRGFKISTTEEKDALHALEVILPRSENDFVITLRSVLCKDKNHVNRFAELYEEYKFELNKATDSKLKQQGKNSDQLTPQQQYIALKNWLYGTNSNEEKDIASFSSLEVLTKKHFSDMDEEEIKLILRVLSKLVQKIARHKSRLRKKTNQKKQADLRLTVKNSLRFGNRFTKLVFSKRKEKHLNLVLLCDVSKSMDLYSKFFIHMIYAFQNVYDRINTFAFSTSIYHISDFLEQHPWDKAFEIISERIPQWSGGTKIGSCMSTFYHNYGYQVLSRKTVVLILSDGWDTGEQELLKQSMSRIYNSCRKLIWLNPLSGNEDFSPEVIGLQTALPYIDQLAPAHNLQSLKDVLKSL